MLPHILRARRRGQRQPVGQPTALKRVDHRQQRESGQQQQRCHHLDRQRGSACRCLQIALKIVAFSYLAFFFSRNRWSVRAQPFVPQSPFRIAHEYSIGSDRGLDKGGTHAFGTFTIQPAIIGRLHSEAQRPFPSESFRDLRNRRTRPGACEPARGHRRRPALETR